MQTSTDDQVTEDVLRERAQGFVERVVEPIAPELDRKPAPALCTSAEVLSMAHQLGLLQLTAPAIAGGSGTNSLAAAAVVEELARGDLGLALLVAQNLALLDMLVATVGPDALGALMGPGDGRSQMLSLAIGEAHGSATSLLHSEDDKALGDTTARRVEGGWVLTGRKDFVLGADAADAFVVVAGRGTQDNSSATPIAFFVKSVTPGVNVARIHEKLGCRFATSCEVVFNECFVDDSMVVGGTSGGASVLQALLPLVNAYSAAAILGSAVELTQRSIEWTSERVQGGMPIIRHDSVAARIGRNQTITDELRAYVEYAAAHAHDSVRRQSATNNHEAELAERLWEVAYSTMQVHGGYAYMNEFGLEKLFRDALTFTHSSILSSSVVSKTVSTSAAFAIPSAPAIDSPRGVAL